MIVVVVAIVIEGGSARHRVVVEEQEVEPRAAGVQIERGKAQVERLGTSPTRSSFDITMVSASAGLPARFLEAIEVRDPVDRVDHRDDAAEAIVLRDRLSSPSVAAMGPRIGVHRGLDDDTRKIRKLVARTPVVKAFQRLLQGSCRARSRGNPNRGAPRRPAAPIDQHVVEAHLAQLVHDHRGVGQRRLAQEAREQRGPAAAQGNP